MSDGNRGLIAAVAGLILVLVALGTGAFFGALYSPTNQQYRAVGESQGAAETDKGNGQGLADLALIPEPIERAIANPPAQSRQEREQRDLAAQEGMAAWAFYMALASIGTMAITTFGTLLIWRQVSLTREAVEDTGRATEAMREANAIARESYLAQSRAYIIVENVTLTPFQHGENPKVCISYKNGGQTPAYRFSSRLSAKIVPASLALELPRELRTKLGKLSNTVISIGPGQVQKATIPIPFSPDFDFTAFYTNQISLAVIGYVTFRDHLGNLRRVIHSHYLPSDLPVHDGHLVMSTTGRGNRDN